MASSPERTAGQTGTVLGAFVAGFGRVRRARAAWLGVWGLTLALAVPVSLVVRDRLATHLNDSVVADRAAQGVEWDWWQEFQQQASGLGTTFVPGIIGGAVPLKNVSDLADKVPQGLAVIGVIGVWLLLWSFVSGGVVDRVARDRVVGGQAFVGACGRYGLRLARLGLLAGAIYWVLFTYVHAWIFSIGYAALTHDVTVERTAFLVRLGGYALFLAILTAVNIAFDYARIRLVVEDRRSALFSLTAGARFVRRHLGQVVGVYALNAALFLVAAGVYVAVAPGARNDGGRLWLALAVGQAYIIARVILKLQFLASQICVFQQALASDVLVSAPAPIWPESPAAERVREAGDASAPSR
jgi:hypothetical protein